MNRQEYLKILFRPNEWATFARSLYDTVTYSVDLFKGSNAYQWVTVNPMIPNTTKSLANISSFRNILLESDNIDHADFASQWEMPYTLKTWSGNKSIHYIICLKEEITREQYIELCTKLKIILNGVIDPASCNAQCFTRLPEGINQKSGQEQKLLEINDTINYSSLYNWINTFDIDTPIIRNNQSDINENKDIYRIPYKYLKWLQEGIISEDNYSRHSKALYLSCWLKIAGYNDEETKEIIAKPFLQENPDKQEKELQSIVDWVYNL